MKLYGFQMPNPFGYFIAAMQPREAVPDDTRRAADVFAAPHMQFYNPNDLSFKPALRPVVPGDGGQIAMGCTMITYDHQPTWNRNVDLAGPVIPVFQRLMDDQRLKHS